MSEKNFKVTRSVVNSILVKLGVGKEKATKLDGQRALAKLRHKLAENTAELELTDDEKALVSAIAEEETEPENTADAETDSAASESDPEQNDNPDAEKSTGKKGGKSKKTPKAAKTPKTPKTAKPKAEKVKKGPSGQDAFTAAFADGKPHFREDIVAKVAKAGIKEKTINAYIALVLTPRFNFTITQTKDDKGRTVLQLKK